jgi:hypothetical protein
MAKVNPVLKELKSAAKGLLFPSETDAVIEAFAWPGGSGPPDEAAVRAGAKIGADVPAEQCTLADLAKSIPEESRGDFLTLFGVLGHHLSGTTVFLFGEVEKTVFVVGRTTDGQYAGVKTKVVET